MTELAPTIMAPLVAAAAERAARRAQAQADGYLYRPQLVPAADLLPLRAAIDDALVRRGWVVDGASDPALGLGAWDDPRWVDFLAEILPSAACRALALHPALLAAVGELVDEPQPYVGDVVRLVSPGAPATPPHQDAAYVARPEAVWTAWLPLGPCPRALGPLAISPGSHAAGLRPHAQVVAGAAAVGTDVPDDAPWHAADLAAGDVILFSAFAVHRALPNRTARQLRVSIDLRYRGR